MGQRTTRTGNWGRVERWKEKRLAAWVGGQDEEVQFSSSFEERGACGRRKWGQEGFQEIHSRTRTDKLHHNKIAPSPPPQQQTTTGPRTRTIRMTTINVWKVRKRIHGQTERHTFLNILPPSTLCDRHFCFAYRNVSINSWRKGSKETQHNYNNN